MQGSSDTTDCGREAGDRIRLLLVTGISGSGKTSALGALADCGFDTIDNPPLRLIHAVIDDFVQSGPFRVRIAIGVDERSNGFSTEGVADTLRTLRARSDVEVSLLFLDCSDDTLLRRFNETRRRHPMSGDDSIQAALTSERAVIDPLREQADFTIDTSELSLTDLRRELQQRFSVDAERGMTISIVSFGFKRGAPREADIMLDVRFMANPYWEPELRQLTGLDVQVSEFVAASPGYDEVFSAFRELLVTTLPYYQRENKSYLTIAIGCTGGKHRSVAFAEQLGEALADAGYQPSLRHRDLKKSVSGRAQAALSVPAAQ